jgi:hypothetical protein
VKVSVNSMKYKTALPVFFIFFILSFVTALPVKAVSTPQKVYISPSDDSLVDDGNANDNFGRLPYLSTQSWAQDDGYLGLRIVGVQSTSEIGTALKFKLTSIPQGATIQKAYLKLYAYRVNSDAPCELYIMRYPSDWNERTITYDNMPSAGAPVGGYRYVVSHVGFLKSTGDEGWEITALVKNWFTGLYPNYGFYLSNRSLKESSLCKYYSKDETVAANQTKKPQLIVEYLPKLEFSSITVPTNQITSSVVNVYWTTNFPIYSVFHYRKAGSANWVSIQNNNRILTDRVILQSLSPNTAYDYQVTGEDAYGRKVESFIYTFTTKGTPISLSRLTPDLSGLVGTFTPANPSSSSQPEPIKIINFSFDTTETGGTIGWTTKVEDGSSSMADKKTSGVVFVSKDTIPTKDMHDFDFGKNQLEVNHTVILKYLEPGTSYNYLVYSEDDGGQTGVINGTLTTREAVVADVDESQQGQPAPADQTPTGEPAPEAPVDSTTQVPTEPEGDVAIGGTPDAEKTISTPSSKNTVNEMLKSYYAPIILLFLILVLLVLIFTKKSKKAIQIPEVEVQKPPLETAKLTQVEEVKNK